ncbi:conserved hypothetical protein [Ricinus communis]|uniref:Uncharacterized protein n=1 Tax=Ricinus communis TaxID=3988 RepID=B9TMS5_RICCO|nr:conserved hypothetical protein [Ricinus communis]
MIDIGLLVDGDDENRQHDGQQQIKERCYVLFIYAFRQQVGEGGDLQQHLGQHDGTWRQRCNIVIDKGKDAVIADRQQRNRENDEIDRLLFA